jgi:hypothetical protein
MLHISHPTGISTQLKPLGDGDDCSVCVWVRVCVCVWVCACAHACLLVYKTTLYISEQPLHMVNDVGGHTINKITTITQIEEDHIKLQLNGEKNTICL